MKAFQGTVVAVVAVAVLLMVPWAASAVVQKDDMNDRIAVATGGVEFTPAAGGYVKTELAQSGSISIQRVKIHTLGGNQDYEVLVTVGPDGSVDFDPVVVVSSGVIHAGPGGKLEIKNLFVGDFDPGTYRVDILVTFAGGFLPFLLACEPFPLVTVTAAGKPQAEEGSWGTIKALYR